jgi:hypothetical protein
MSDMFSIIANTMDQENEREEGNRARIASTKRLERRFLSYLKKATSTDELDQRIAMIEQPARKAVKNACEEHCYSRPEELYGEVIASLREAAQPETGDTYQQERESLPSADASGLGSEGSPKIDKGKVPADGLDPIDVKSVQHPLTNQSVKDVPEYGDRHDGPADADPTDSPRTTVDADSPMQPELTNGPNTDTWSDKGTQADPVTSHVEAKWSVLDR